MPLIHILNCLSDSDHPLQLVMLQACRDCKCQALVTQTQSYMSCDRSAC